MPENLTQLQRWCLALGDNLSLNNGWTFDALGVSLEDPEQLKKYRENIKNSWNIRDTQSLLRTLGELKAGLHNMPYQSDRMALFRIEPDRRGEYIASVKEVLYRCRFEVVNKYAHSLGPGGVYAFDAARAVFLVRVGFSLKWIEEQVAWSYLKELAHKVQPLFSGWQEYALSYLVGREYLFADEQHSISSNCLGVYQDCLNNHASHWAWPWLINLEGN